jgi:hypothetical protein
VSSRHLPITPWRAWLLALLLLGAQWAGLSHRVSHTTAPALAAVQAPASGDHQPGTADCRLIDQLAHADALCGPPLTPQAVLQLAGSLPAQPVLSQQAPAPALYQARAPPAFERA